MRLLKSRFSTVYLMLILFSLIINPYLAKSQDPLKDLQVSGSSVQFIFSSLSNFNNGIELDGWTRLKIKYKYTGKNGWRLMVKALESSIIHEGGDPLNDIALADLKIIATITSSDDPSIIISNPFTLTDFDQVLLSGIGGDPNKVNVELTISYSIGTPPATMINKAEGMYFVMLRFLLVEID